MKKLILILIFSLSLLLFSQYEWSDPIMLSETGNFPSINYAYPAITVDKSGSIHVFWAKVIESEPWEWYYQIEYSKSTDGGITWSATENLTPEYTEDRIYEIEAVCDSQNNVHLVYLRGFENCKVMYKKFDGTSWSDPYEIYGSATKRIRLGIDSIDRLYVTWSIGGNAYYSYNDVLEQASLWSNVKIINNEINHNIKDFVFDQSNNLYAIGTEGIVNNYKPISFKYDRMKEEWVDFKVFQSYEESSLGGAIAISSKDSLYTNTLIGNASNNRNYIQAKFKIDSTWTAPVFINENTGWDGRQMFIDANDNLHLFEVYLGNNAEILYSIRQNGIWIPYIIQSDPSHTFGNIDVAFNNIDSLYIVYTKADISTYSGKVYFQTKRIDTGIIDNDEFITDNYELAQNYPNPFNNSTEISYTVKEVCNVELSVFNSKGMLVDELVNNKMKKGRHSMIFNADMLSSGIYYYSLKIDGVKKETKKMLYLR